MKMKRWLSCITPDALKRSSAIFLTSVLLGLVCNASSPVGIRWSDPSRSSPLSSQPDQAIAPRQPAIPVANSVPPSLAAATANSNSFPSDSIDPAPPPSTDFVPPTPASWTEIKPLALQGQVLMVDARPHSFFEAGHIPRAVNLPEPPSPQEWTVFCQQYSTNTPIVVYCSSTSCSISFKLAARLAKEGGYTFVRYMTGGYLEYLREEILANLGGLAAAGNSSLVISSSGEMSVLDAALLPPRADRKLENALPITWAQTRPLLAINQAVLLDARSKEEYDKGHITGALSLPAESSIETIRQVLARQSSTTRLIAYCGASGCPEAFQLATRLMKELDFPNAQFMLDGYAEWRRDQKNARAQKGGGS